MHARQWEVNLKREGKKNQRRTISKLFPSPSTRGGLHHRFVNGMTEWESHAGAGRVQVTDWRRCCQPSSSGPDTRLHRTLVSSDPRKDGPEAASSPPSPAGRSSRRDSPASAAFCANDVEPPSLFPHPEGPIYKRDRQGFGTRVKVLMTSTSLFFFSTKQKIHQAPFNPNRYHCRHG